MSDTEAILRWLVVMCIVSFSVAPLIWWLGAGLGRVRHGIVRPLGIVLVTGMLWWPAAVAGLPFSRTMIVAVLVAAGIASWLWWWRADHKMDLGVMLAFEVLWHVLFVCYAVFRSFNPDIANTEKPMEIALLSSVSRSSDVPAPDPWFAGEAINYYYFGYQVVGMLVKLTGVPPAIAFNLALATLFASIGTAAVAMVYRLTSAAGVRRSLSMLSAGLAAFFLLFAGNLDAIVRIIKNPGETLATGWWYDDLGWQSSRIIVDHGVHGSSGPTQTINEFPAFSFILGDLHPHVLTYPLLLGIAAIVAGMACVPSTATTLRVTAIGALTGLLYVSNSWDAPLGALLLCGVLLMIFGWKTRQSWIRLRLFTGSALLTALPFLLHFTAPVGVDAAELPGALRHVPVISTLLRTLGVVTWRPSSATELLIVHGHWICAFVLFAVVAFRSERRIVEMYRSRFDVVAVVLLAMFVLAAVWMPAIVLLGIPGVIAVSIAMFHTSRPVKTIGWLFACGFFVTLIPEFIYIQDAFGNRMNTVFKLYFQAWLLFSVASAAGIGTALAAVRGNVRFLASFVAVILVVAVLPYTPLSARDWTSDFTQRRGLDGAAYIKSRSVGEAAAIDWIAHNAATDTIIVESPGCSYQSVAGIPLSRISAFSGVPTIIGWAGHEEQWRRGEAHAIRDRIEARQQFANDWLSGTAIQTVDFPAPDYIVLGLPESSGSSSCEPAEAHDRARSRALLEADGWHAVFAQADIVILGRN